MAECPRCHQPVEAQAIACPHCRATLKAYGHPGIPLHKAMGATYLCQTCTYDADDTCTFPQRPHAKDCTLYHNRLQPAVEPVYRPSGVALVRAWVSQNLALIVLIGLLGISILIALSR